MCQYDHCSHTVWFQVPEQTSEPFICLSKYISQTIKSRVSVNCYYCNHGYRVWEACGLVVKTDRVRCVGLRADISWAVISDSHVHVRVIEHLIIESSFSVVRMLQWDKNKFLGFLCVWVCVFLCFKSDECGLFFVRLNAGFLDDWMSVRPDRNFPCTVPEIWWNTKPPSRSPS